MAVKALAEGQRMVIVADDPDAWQRAGFAVVIGMVYIFIPFMFLPLYASVEKLDMAMVEASFDLGAGRWQTFRRVILPMTLPGVVGGSIIVFIPSLGNFIVPSLLGGAKVGAVGVATVELFLMPDGEALMLPPVGIEIG